MTRFIAQLNDGSFINIPANSMAFDNNSILVYHESFLVAYLDVAAVVVAHLSDKAGEAK